MRLFAVLAVMLLALPAWAAAKTAQECFDELDACARSCCNEHGGAIRDVGGRTECDSMEYREYQSTCGDPCRDDYNMCMMGATGSNPAGVPGLGGCCGSFAVLLFAASAGFMFARKK